MKLLRWILFIPVSFGVGYLTQMILEKIFSIITIFSSWIEFILNNFLTSLLTGLISIIVAYLIIPDYKNKVLKYYSLILTFILIGDILFFGFAQSKGIASGLYIIIIDRIGFIIGIWWAYKSMIISLNKTNDS